VEIVFNRLAQRRMKWKNLASEDVIETIKLPKELSLLFLEDIKNWVEYEWV